MEVFVEYEVSCANDRSAESMMRLFRSLAENGSETDLASIFEAYDPDSNALGDVAELVERQADNLACLQSAEAEGLVFRSTFVCGWGAENFLADLAEVTASLQASIVRLTAQYDEGVYVCDLIDGNVHLEEFENYETYLETGFVELDDDARAFESIADVLAGANEARPEKEVYQQSPEDKEKYADQERAILSIAKQYYESNFNGLPLDFDEWYSEEYRALGALDWYEGPEDLAESNKAWAEEHGGVKKIDLRVKGQIEGLVSIDAEIALNDGKVKDSNTCWVFQNDRWKLHNSCAQIWIETQNLSDEKAKVLREMEDLFGKMLSGN